MAELSDVDKELRNDRRTMDFICHMRRSAMIEEVLQTSWEH